MLERIDFTRPDSWAARIARGKWAEDLTLQRLKVLIGPRNAWSNVAYVAAGVAVFFLSDQPIRVPMAVALLMLGAGSFWYHGWKGLLANCADWMGMYPTVIVSAMIAYAPRAPTLAAWFVLGFAVLFGAAFSFRKRRFDWHMGGFFLLACIPLALAGEWMPLLQSAGLFALGYGAWHLDKRKDKPLGLWGHAIWHVLSAAGILRLVLANLARA
jgi:hypothetical protein